MKKYIPVVLLLLIVCAAVFKAPSVPVQAADAAPALSVKKKTLYVGYKSYSIRLKNTAEDASVTYTSTNEAAATVDDEGVVSPQLSGTAKIMIVIHQNDTDYTLTFKVTVKKPYFKIDSITEGLLVGQSFTFKLQRYGYRDTPVWSLTGSQYAEISAESPTECVITAKAPGSVLLKVTSLGLTYTYDILIYEGSGELYIIDEFTEPINSVYMTYSSYNRYTKSYYVLRSCLERLDKAGGGVIVLKPGTYSITNTLCIPSNTTIYLQDGVTIRKSDKTNTSLLTATRSMFQTVSYTHAAIEGAFKGYGGEHDIAIIGEGKAVFDMNFLNCAMIVIAHSTNVTIRGIQFTNMNTNHFIELDASKNVTIAGNLFTGYTKSSTFRKEAINIDTPDLLTGGFKQYWTSYDGTPNKNIYITDNTFIDLESAIGTHKYTEGKVHTNIQITGNTFCNIYTYAIRAMNWANSTITGNYFYNAPDYTAARNYALILNGVSGSTITKNRICGFYYPISAYHWANTGDSSVYAPIYNSFTDAEMTAMKKNYVSNNTCNYIEFYETLGEFNKGLTKYYFASSYLE